MEAAGTVTPLFLSAFYDAMESLRPGGTYDLPTIEDINSLCRETGVGFEIHPPDIVPRHVVMSRLLSDLTKTTAEVLRLWKESDARDAEQPVQRELPDSFDVAITVAGPERKLARVLAHELEAAGLAVFYDELYPEHLWGQNLADTFDAIFRLRSLFCVMFISRAYAASEWTNHERQSALARALKERGKAYILPVRVDETELPGLPSTIGFVSLQEHGIKKIAQMLIKKVRSVASRRT